MSVPVDPGRATEGRLRQILQKRDAFLATAIGRAFNAFEIACFQDKGDLVGRCLARQKWQPARTELLKLLYEAAGVGEYDDGK